MQILIPHAADAVRPDQIERTPGPDGPAIRYRLPAVSVEPGRALRLNSGQIEFGTPPSPDVLADTDRQLDFLCRHFQQQCGMWSKYARRFVDRYFAFVRLEIDTHRPELERLLAPFGDLFAVEDWAFSALRPLPRAHLPAPGPGRDRPPESLVRTDVAFWTAAGAVAIDLVGRTTPRDADRERHALLRAAGVSVVCIPHEALDTDDDAAFADRLPNALRRFWLGEALPSGPFGAGPTAWTLPEGDG